MIRHFIFCIAALAAALVSSASAHFIWLVPKTADDGNTVVNVYFAEDASDNSTQFLTRLRGIRLQRVRHIEAASGTLNGRKYPETRHDSTIVLNVPDSDSTEAGSDLQNLPQPVTSFGAATVNNSLYVYGGHTGEAHSYSRQQQSNELTRLDLNTGKWTTVIDGPPLQGLALVTRGGKLYRVGGFTAKNADGEDHNLWSQNTVACFDPSVGAWNNLSPLPECRSSHDAAVVGDSIYVVGGWAMKGNAAKKWHTTGWKMDLTNKDPRWEAIAAPPFRRRALALAAHDGKLYVIGGMQKEGGPTTAVDVYHPGSNTWSDGPSLFVNADPQPVEDAPRAQSSMSSGHMAGFGASAFATGGSLYVTTVQGVLQRLSSAGRKWDVVSTDVTPRFFHRLLPLDDTHLIVVGGSNMNIGKFDEVEVIDVRQSTQ